MAAPLPPPRSRLILERVLGLTALSNAMVAVNPVSGELAYAAGCIVVLYNLRRNKQVRYYRVDKSVACLSFSPNGQYLAIGEKGYMPAITIWDGADGSLCAELQRHQYGVACLAFSKDGRFLLSAGLVHDQHVYAWELKTKRKENVKRLEVTPVGCAQAEDKILAMDYCEAGNFFVTVGEKHFKYWFLDESGSFLVTGLHVNDLPELQHRDAVASTKAASTFTGVGCGYGVCQLKTFAVTSDGTLCCFGASGIMERLVSLETNSGNALSVTESYVAVGGASGIVRLFDPASLEYRTTLPFPPAFGTANNPPEYPPSSALHPADPFRYPAVLAVRISGSHVIAVYSDRSIFIYGTSNPDAVTVERSFLFHSGGIRGLEVAGSVKGISAKGKIIFGDGTSSAGGNIMTASDEIPTGTFVTCSDDNTVRMWHLDLHRRPAKPSRFEASPKAGRLGHEVWKNPYSQEMLRVIYNDRESDFLNENCVVLGGTCTNEDSNAVHSPPKGTGRNKGFRTLAVRPDQKEIVSGDQEGNVVVIPAALETPVSRIDAHSSSVHCLTYSGIREDKTILMASGGKDRLIQLYDCRKDHTVLSTLETHSSAVMTVALSRDGNMLLSSGADNTVSVASIDEKGGIIGSKSLPVNGGKIFDMVLLPDNDSIVASRNSRLEILSAETAKCLKAHVVGEQHRLAICPANFCAAMSGSLAERTIHVVDIINGETLATGTGHSEAITALRFTPDCRRLLSASSDGCIFVWRLGDDIQMDIKSHLPTVTEDQGPVPAPPQTNADLNFPPSTLPPLAPPISAPRKVRPTNNNTDNGTAVEGKDDSNSHNYEVEANDTATVATAEVPKIPARDWKGKGAAVPGPMADIPMEDWMRTRETAKPIVQMANGNPSSEDVRQDATGKPFGGTLAIDRSQTPDWAKTELTVVNLQAPDDDAKTRQLAAGGKWGNNVATALLSGENPSPVQIPGTAEPSISRGQPAAATGNLSVDTMTPNPANSTTLGLEREQLEKRKKQMDTVNAVAAMNTRLSQLGLIRSPKAPTTPAKMEGRFAPSPLKWNDAPRITSNDDNKVRKLPPSVTKESSAARTINVPAAPTPQNPGKTIGTTDQRGDSATEVVKSPEIAPPPPKENKAYASPTLSTPSMQPNEPKHEEVATTAPAIRPIEPEVKVSQQEKQKTDPEVQVSTPSSVNDDSLSRTSEMANESFTSDEDVDKMTDELVNQALHELEREKRERASSSEPVEASLSAFTVGYRGDPHVKLGEVDRSAIRSHCYSEVDASLSMFTSGFVSHNEPPEAKGDAVTENSTEKENMSASLSAFTSGYSDHADTKEVTTSQGETVSTSPMDVSMSKFTSGYSSNAIKNADKTLQQQDISLDMSLSCFTSGYGDDKSGAVAPPVCASSEITTNPVKESLSTFTTGYSAAVSPMAITKDPVSNHIDKSIDVQAPSPAIGCVGNVDDSLQTVGDSQNESKRLESKLRQPTVRFKLQQPSTGLKDENTANAISDLELPLENAAIALEQVLSSQSPVGDADPKLQEIHRLVSELRAVINSPATQ